jgi:hypothetical protein
MSRVINPAVVMELATLKKLADARLAAEKYFARRDKEGGLKELAWAQKAAPTLKQRLLDAFNERWLLLTEQQLKARG